MDEFKFLNILKRNSVTDYLALTHILDKYDTPTKQDIFEVMEITTIHAKAAEAERLLLEVSDKIETVQDTIEKVKDKITDDIENIFNEMYKHPKLTKNINKEKVADLKTEVEEKLNNLSDVLMDEITNPF
jgi:chromosome condensin MukBEF complex kleisin-like MukF subunit